MTILTAEALFEKAFQSACSVLAPSNEREKVFVDTAAGIAGPVLTSYVHWVFCQAQSQGLQKIYFVSRDGQILHRIAQVLNAQLKLPIELCYLYGGRQAWNLPGLLEFKEDDLNWIFYAPEFLTVRGLFERLQIQPQEIQQTLMSAGFEPVGWDTNLSADQICQLRRVVETPLLQELILKKAESARRGLTAYLKQEKLFDSRPWGFVDVGWFGRLQNALGRIIQTEGGLQPQGFYFALWPHAFGDDFGKRSAYYFDGRNDSRPNVLTWALATWLEIFTAADHGVVLGYENKAGTYQPVLKMQLNTQAMDWGLLLVQKAILAFSQSYAESLVTAPPPADSRLAVEHLLNRWIHSPRLTEVVVWGTFKTETDQTGAFQYSAARKLTWKDAVDRLMGRKISDLSYLSWPAGCLVITPVFIRGFFKLAERARRTAAFFVRTFKMKTL